MSRLLHILFYAFIVITVGCQSGTEEQAGGSRHADNQSVSKKESKVPEGMVYIPGGTFVMGSEDRQANATEGPEFPVQLDGFYMDEHEVTNAQFREFVEATGYVTVAERKITWEDIKFQLPEGTPRPPDSLLQPGSLVFAPIKGVANLYDITQWWKWEIGASWQHPYGPGSDIKGKDDHPVVHVSYEDAEAYAKWAGKRLPTEAEWEYASRGGIPNNTFAWGNELMPDGRYLANFFQGTFPEMNTKLDGFEKTAPVKSFEPNAYGLYDMIGNVWEWTSDWYRPDAHKMYKDRGYKVCVNPMGPVESYDPDEPLVPKRVIKGGSYLCSKEYCSNYRPSARMATAFDSGQEHLGFRCVKDKY